MHEYVSAMHVHTRYSDGRYDVEKIAGEGAVAGVDLIFVTDHNTDKVRRLGEEGWYGSVLVLSGYELNDPRDKNHYLVFGMDRCLDGSVGARNYVREVRGSGGMGFLAHPDERRAHLPEHPPYEWTDWDIEEFDGIEIWNYMSEWMEALRPGRRLLNLFFPDRTIHGPTEKLLAFWDRCSMQRKVVAIGSVDAHAHAHRLLWFTVSIFPYRFLFRRIRTHLLTRTSLKGTLEFDRSVVLEALREGRAFVSNMREGDARGFSFTAKGAGETAWMGDAVPLSRDLVLEVSSPLRGSIALICDGRSVTASAGTHLTCVPRSTGSYRVEVRRKGKPWIFSNAIRVTDATSG
jgi:hypothetical protein